MVMSKTSTVQMSNQAVSPPLNRGSTGGAAWADAPRE
jgi:hypothetical protein